MPRDGIQPMYLSRAEIGLVRFPRAAEFGVRVAAMGQVITEIGIIRDTPDGGVAAWQPACEAGVAAQKRQHARSTR
jgi:hypothetical protein